MTSVIIASFVFCIGIGLIFAAFFQPRAGDTYKVRFSDFLIKLLPSAGENDESNLRLAGITQEVYAMQRFGGFVVGLVGGFILSLVLGSGPLWTAATVTSLAVGGWFFPMLGIRDTAKKARSELDQVIRVWVVLVAQQVSAGVDPSVAMLDAAQMGKRPAWRLLYRYLLAAQEDRRAVWEGLSDVVQRYGVYTLMPAVSALGLAAERGTRVSEAVLVAASTLWEDTISRQRESAAQQSQIVVLPATGIALALAGILIYPPFTFLTGGGVSGL